MSIMRRQDGETEIDLLEIFRLLLQKAPVIIVCTLLCGLIAYAGTHLLVTPQYRAYITLYVNNSAGKESSTTITQSDLNASAHLVDTYSAIITSRSVLDEVITVADVDMDVETLQSRISTSALNNTEVFRVTIQDPDPKAAARVANAIATVAPDRIANTVEGSSVKVVDYAEIPTKISSPSYSRMMLLGVMVGFAASAAFIMIRALMDSSIKSESDFSQWNYPVLCTIPDLEDARKNTGKGYGYGYGYVNSQKKK